MWYEKVVQIFKIPDLRKKILFTLGILAIFRLMANLPIPGISSTKMREFFEGAQIFGLLNLFTGGALDKLSVAMLGLGPYITAVIIMQLLTMIFPSLEKLYKEEGEQGRQKFNQYSRILTVPLALLQAYSMLMLLQRQGIIESLSWSLILMSSLTVTAGAMFLMWLGELISEKGIGNGVSLLIFAGIVAIVPVQIRQIILTWEPSLLPSYLAFFAVSFFIIAGVVLVNEGRRNIPVSYAKRVRGTKIYGGVSTYLPLNVNPAGVIPIIFAMSILLFPGMIANFLTGSSGVLGTIAFALKRFFENVWVYNGLYFVLIVLFTYFYTAVTFDPKAIATNLQKMGGFVPGIRPGESTAKFMHFILNRVLLVGAIFLGFIAVLPSVVGSLTGITIFRFLIGGTSLLIVVSVVLDLVRQIKAQLQMREYEIF